MGKPRSTGDRTGSAICCGAWSGRQATQRCQSSPLALLPQSLQRASKPTMPSLAPCCSTTPTSRASEPTSPSTRSRPASSCPSRPSVSVPLALAPNPQLLDFAEGCAEYLSAAAGGISSADRAVAGATTLCACALRVRQPTRQGAPRRPPATCRAASRSERKNAVSGPAMHERHKRPADLPKEPPTVGAVPAPCVCGRQ